MDTGACRGDDATASNDAEPDIDPADQIDSGLLRRRRELSLRLDEFVRRHSKPRYVTTGLSEISWDGFSELMIQSSYLVSPNDYVKPEDWINQLEDSPCNASRFCFMASQAASALDRVGQHVTAVQAVSEGLNGFSAYLDFHADLVKEANADADELVLARAEELPLTALLETAEQLFDEHGADLRPKALVALRRPGLTTDISWPVADLAQQVFLLDPANQPSGGGGPPWQRGSSGRQTRMRIDGPADYEPRRYYVRDER